MIPSGNKVAAEVAVSSTVAPETVDLVPNPADDVVDQPAVQETSEVGGWVWIVLFGAVILLSLVANLALSASILANRKKHKLVYFFLLLLFAINLVDYVLLAFEFSLGVEHVFPYGHALCTAYQVTLRSSPILQAWTVVVLLHYTSNVYLIPDEDRATTSVSARVDVTRVSHASGNHCAGGRTSNVWLFGSILLGLLLAQCLFSIPTAYFATIVEFGPSTYGEASRTYCEIDLSILAHSPDNGQMAVSLYYLIYSAFLSYWLPLMVRTENQEQGIVF